MTAFWLGVLVGMVIGALIGALVVALCVAASRAVARCLTTTSAEGDDAAGARQRSAHERSDVG